VNCRHCATALSLVFLDLGCAPPSNAYLDGAALSAPEVYYPLKLYVCRECWLVQTQDFARAEELFNEEYAYFSSVSETWLQHAADYCRMITARLGISRESRVVEVASNDGYLLRNFVSAGVPCVGIEPTGRTADAAEAIGVPVVREFFGERLAKRLAEAGRADLIIGNNVYAHVPDINDFTRGLQALLAKHGTLTLEFPHLLRLVEGVQFDTVYHEHFSYLSLYTVQRVFSEAGLRVLDVEQLHTHGGSLRVFGGHTDDPRETTGAVGALLDAERGAGLLAASTYGAFQARADAVKNGFLEFLIAEKRAGHAVAAYGAAAKGNTLLNYAGVKPDLIPYVCDAAPSKQGRFLPGSHIPILVPAAIVERSPDTIVILPWNIADEVASRLGAARGWGAKFVTAVPAIRVF
jgi:hypothetical protein